MRLVASTRSTGAWRRPPPARATPRASDAAHDERRKSSRATANGSHIVSERPLVSIVMPTYDRLQFLPATVESIFAQTLRDWELIVADDGSSAPAAEYLRALERRERVRVLWRSHTGNAGKMRNAALEHASAPFVAFMDSDDLWAPTKLETQLAKMRAEPNCGWSYSAFVLLDAQDVPLPSERSRRWIPHHGHVFDAIVRGAVSIRSPSVVMARTELVREVGAFDEAIDCAEDFDLWARLALRSPICVVDEPLVRVHTHPNNNGRTIGSAPVARDYSLRKLAALTGGRTRALVANERSRNALAHSAALAAHGDRWTSLAPVASSLRFSWRYPGWWFGAAKAVARACCGTARTLPGAARTRSPSVDRVEAGLDGRPDKLRTGDR
jgi:GT2 family glycosyltransferase